MKALLLTVPLFLLLAALAGCDAVNDPESAGTDAATAMPDEATARALPTAELAIPDRYIVVLAEEPVAEARSSAASDLRVLAAEVAATGTVRHVYEHALTGFAAAMSAAEAAALAKDPRVLYVEQDRRVFAFGSGAQSSPTWGLNRVDQRALPLDNAYTWNTSGAGVTAYVIDTGIRIGHNEFGGRAAYGYDFVGNDPNADDCNGHGTHVAGTVGGTTYGVAKDVALVAVRVLDCNGSGSYSGVIAGVDWVTANHAAPAVANMSLGGGASSSVDAAVRNSIASGVQYAVAAGNDNRDACTYSPARTAEAMTVGSTTSSDSRSSFSNYGSCVDFFAPGSSITSAWYTSNSATNTISGTSMAAPHAAGVAALYLEANPMASAQQVRDALYQATTKDVVSNAASANDHLLYSLVTDAGGGGNPNVPPTASFTYSCAELSCTFDGSGSSDPDGTITSYAWTFGDGSSASGAAVSHTYGSGGTRTVTLTVTDNANASDGESQSITVSEPPAGGITLSATGYKQQGRHRIDLTWGGATSSQVDVYRNGSKTATTANDGAYTDATGGRGSATYTHQVCEAGTSVCSNVTTTSF